MSWVSLEFLGYSGLLLYLSTIQNGAHSQFVVLLMSFALLTAGFVWLVRRERE